MHSKIIKVDFNGLGGAETHRAGYEGLSALESLDHLPKNARALITKTSGAFRKDISSALYHIRQFASGARGNDALTETFQKGYEHGLTRIMDNPSKAVHIFNRTHELHPDGEKVFLRASIESGMPLAVKMLLDADYKPSPRFVGHIHQLGRDSMAQSPCSLVLFEQVIRAVEGNVSDNSERDLLAAIFDDYDAAAMREEMMNMYRQSRYRELVALRVQMRQSDFFTFHKADFGGTDMTWFNSDRLLELAANHSALMAHRNKEGSGYREYTNFLIDRRSELTTIPLISFLNNTRDKIPDFPAFLNRIYLDAITFGKYSILAPLATHVGLPNDEAKPDYLHRLETQHLPIQIILDAKEAISKARVIEPVTISTLAAQEAGKPAPT